MTEEAKEYIRCVERPQGTILRLDPVNQQVPGETRVRLATGKPKGDDQVVEHEGEILLRIARPLSEELNGSSIDLVDTLEGPTVGIKPPPTPESLPDGS